MPAFLAGGTWAYSSLTLSTFEYRYGVTIYYGAQK